MPRWSLFVGGSPNPIANGDDTLDPNALILQDPVGTAVWSVSRAGVASQQLGAATAEAYTATVAIDATKPFHRIAGDSATSATSTFNAAFAGVDGQKLEIEVTAITNTCTITFGTNFKPSTTLAVTASHFASVYFVSDGTNWKEHSRSAIIAS